MKLLVANWKMNPSSAAEAKKLAKATDDAQVIICPPFLFLEQVGSVLKKASLGAQNVFWEESGAYTGEVSSEQLKKVGAKYVIIGHSERRRYLHEDDTMISKKVKAVLECGLIPILAVGENAEERSQQKTLDVIKNQLDTDLSLLLGIKMIPQLIIAYEPVWAIGSGQSDDPKETVKIIKFAKEFIKDHGLKIKDLRFLYGGSVNSNNVKGFLQHEEIDGFLIGGASLKSDEMKKIIMLIK